MNVKSKGNSFERDISKKLSRWYSSGERDDLFWRTQSSGARCTIRRKNDKDTENQEGDICSTSSKSVDFINKISIECKHYKDIQIWRLLEGEGKLIDWYKKIRDESNGKIPIVIFKQNNRSIYMLCGRGFIQKFEIWPKCYIKIDDEITALGLYNFNDFLKDVPVEYFEKKLGEL